MCSLQAEQQSDHEALVKHRQIILNEVTVFYRIGSSAFEMSIDPGVVSVLFWDEAALSRYLGGPLIVGPLYEEITPDTGNSPFPAVPTKETLPYGVLGRIFFQTSDGRTFVTHDQVVTTHVVARYESRVSKQQYELALPTHTHDASRSAQAGRPMSGDAKYDQELDKIGMGAFNSAQISMGIDVLFWDAEICENYRREFAKTHSLGTHALFMPDGTAHRKQLPGGGGGYINALFLPGPLTRAPRFHSTTCSVCYHYENCQWACTVDAP